MIGADGAATLLLSNLIIVASIGLTLFWVLGRVYRVARYTDTAPHPRALAMVLGFRLKGNELTQEYAGRLLRACALYRQGRIQQILVLGGQTGTAAVSEAEQGRRFLISQGVAHGCVLVEENSVHTLENLRNARATLKDLGSAPIILVTSRYHLARSGAMAAGFGLQPVPCSAEDRLSHNPGTLLRLVREAWFLHWYYIGSNWSRWARNKKSLARIS
jgi:uncharacterized SAM-binding protein YcdF (DUF218 family)